jgi:uncharacterized membrane protein
MLLLVLALGALVAVLWKRLSTLTSQQAELIAEQRTLRMALDAFEKKLRTLSVVPPAPAATPPPPAIPQERPSAITETQPVATPHPGPPPAPAAASLPPPSIAGSAIPHEPPLVTSHSAAELDSIAAASRWVVEFFTTGNVVAKVGMIVVFFGVAFLLRYAAERGMLPIEYRLIATAVGAVVLLAVGWRLRRSRPEYAVVLQGGAVGVLYLTIFAAFRLYALVPATLTFALLLVVVAFSAVLAVAQNAMSLAVLGTSGGFLAPILASTGSGSHVALFSYYAVLNAGIVGIAWFRAWRFLNWLAFVFTFGIGFAWGQQYYQPALFSTTEPFLILFFLLFLGVAVIFAHRQPARLRGYIDGSLVFGTPAIAFAMQSVLVRDIPLGRAYSAVVLSALYLTLTRLLWRRDAALRPLAEAFLALAVVFLIIAVPLAFDGHATAAAWALEGSGLVWIGIRQQRQLARVVGVALLLGGGVAFASMAAPYSTTPVLNSRFLGGAAIAVGSVIAGRLLSRARENVNELERPFEWVLLTWGLLWWFGAVMVETADHVPTRLVPAAFLLTTTGSGCVIAMLARRWQWRAMMLETLPIGPATWVAAMPWFLLKTREGPLTDLGWFGWLAALAINYLLLFWFESVWPRLAVSVWHSATTWVVMFLATWSAAVVVRQAVADASIWSSTVWCLVPVLFVLAMATPRPSWPWPFRHFPSLYAFVIPAAPAAAILLWVVWASAQEGAPAPLPYMPVLNPLELTQAFGLLAAYGWSSRATHGINHDALGSVGRWLVAPLAFLALNAAVGRVVHFFLGVPFDFDDLVDSGVFQTGISILWGIVAGGLMTLARLRRDRTVWMVGAGVLAALIIKLFLVDFGNVGGLARIVSFLVTGVVILLIGYFAPAPPRTSAPAQEQTT